MDNKCDFCGYEFNKQYEHKCPFCGGEVEGTCRECGITVKENQMFCSDECKESYMG